MKKNKNRENKNRTNSNNVEFGQEIEITSNKRRNHQTNNNQSISQNNSQNNNQNYNEDVLRDLDYEFGDDNFARRGLNDMEDYQPVTPEKNLYHGARTEFAEEFDECCDNDRRAKRR